MDAPQGPAHPVISATSDAVLAVDKASWSEALDSRLWERRGFLKRLARADSPG